MIVALACASLPCLAQPPELSALPEQFRTRTEFDYVEFAIPEINRTQKKFTLEANTWYLRDRIIVALKHEGHLEVVSWIAWVEDYKEFESATRYFLDPDAKSYLNRGGNNNYGPGDVSFGAAVLSSLHNARIAARTPDLWTQSAEGVWALRLPYAPKVTRSFATEAGRLTGMQMTSQGSTSPYWTEVYRGEVIPELSLGGTIAMESWAKIQAGSRIQSSRATSRVVEVEILPDDITEEEVLASLTNGLLEIRLEEYFDADSKTVTSMRRGVTAPPRSPVGDSKGSVIYSSEGAPPATRSRFGIGGIALAALAVVAVVIGFLVKRGEAGPKRKR